MPEGTTAAHASSLQVMPASSPALLTLFWFSGERESGPLVQIAASQLDRRTHTWAAPRFVVNRHTLGAQLGFGVRRLGNPVVWMDAQGRMHLFVVATGGGGWAASRVVHLQQSSTSQALADLAFEPVGVLPLSWLWNTSMLVRNAPLPLADGGMVLPVHFELGLKYPVALRFDAQGQFMGMVRMSQRTHALQPTLLVLSPQSWVALMRDERAAGRVLAARTTDGGQHWSDLPDLDLVNPDASVAGLTLAPGQQLLAHNSSPGSRATLDLSHSTDGLQWQRVGTIEQGAQADEFSYPAMAWADGSLWVAYTVDRQRLAWQQWKPGGCTMSTAMSISSVVWSTPFSGLPPALPALGLVSWALAVGWAVVLAWLAVTVLARCRMPRSVQWGAAAAMAAWCLVGLTGAKVFTPVYVLGMAFQQPSTVTLWLCAVGLWRHARGRAGGAAYSPPAEAAVRAGAGWWAWVWPVAGVVLGWVLLLDSFAQLPLQASVYAWGFSPWAVALVLGLGLLPWVLCPRVACASPAAWAVPVAVVWQVALHLPTGNVWDAVLDPWLWLVLHNILLHLIHSRLRHQR